jgi:twinkle protein
MAVYEMWDRKYPAVSVRSAGSAVDDVARSYEYLNSFEKIVVCFDKDEAKVNPATGEVFYPGQEAALKVAAMFEPKKVRVLTLSEAKDPNDYLLKGYSRKFQQEWYQAPEFVPSGLKLGRDMWDEVSKIRTYDTVPYPFDTMNNKTYGLRLSELVVFTAKTGVGKTSVLKEIEADLLKNAKYGVGLLHLEESNYDTALGLMSIEANKPLHLPDVRETVTTEDLKSYYDKSINTDRLVIYDHFGSNSIHEILAKVRHMHALGCKYIVLDHISIVVSDQSGDERKQLDEITTKLKTLTMELNISIICVVHLNREGLIRGTAAIEQLANIVFMLERDIDSTNEWRRNVTKLVTKKNRFCGRIGPTSWLFYDGNTGRLTELDEEEVNIYEAGENPREEFGWA